MDPTSMPDAMPEGDSSENAETPQDDKSPSPKPKNEGKDKDAKNDKGDPNQELMESLQKVADMGITLTDVVDKAKSLVMGSPPDTAGEMPAAFMQKAGKASPGDNKKGSSSMAEKEDLVEEAGKAMGMGM